MTSSCSPFLSCSGLRGFCRVRAAESMATNSAAMGIVIAAPLFLGRLSQGRCQRLPPAFGQALRTTLLDPRKTCQPSSRMAHGIRGLQRDGITPVFRRGAQVPASIQAFDHVQPVADPRGELNCLLKVRSGGGLAACLQVDERHVHQQACLEVQMASLAELGKRIFRCPLGGGDVA